MESPIRHIFLDLEDTIITPVVNGWFTTELINVQKINEVIGNFRPHFIHVFSFAIWDKHELDRFNKGTRPMLELALGAALDLVPTVDDDIIPAACRVLRLSPATIDFSDASAFWGKHESFRLFCRDTFKPASNDLQIEVLLLDDAVINESFEWPDLRIKGHILNIDQL